MKLEHEPRQRCGECGAQCPTLLRMERGPPFCIACMAGAHRLLLNEVELRLDDEKAAGIASAQRIARRMLNPNDDLRTGKKLGDAPMGLGFAGLPVCPVCGDRHEGGACPFV